MNRREVRPLKIAAAIALAAVLAALFAGCTYRREGEALDNYVLENLGCDEIVFTDEGAANGPYAVEGSTPNFVLARKDGEDVFWIVPDNVNYEASESEWPFDRPFDKIFALLNKGVGKDVYAPEWNRWVDLDESNYYLAQEADIVCDTGFALRFFNYAITQADGELYFFRCDKLIFRESDISE